MYKLFLHHEIPDMMIANESTQRWYFLLTNPGCNPQERLLLVTRSATCRRCLSCNCWGSRIVDRGGWTSSLCLGFFTHSWNGSWSETNHHARYTRLFTLAALCARTFLTFNRRSVAAMSTVYLLLFFVGFPLWRTKILIFVCSSRDVKLSERRRMADGLLSCSFWIVSWCTRFPACLQVICYYWMFMKYVLRPSVHRYWEPAFVINRLVLQAACQAYFRLVKVLMVLYVVHGNSQCSALFNTFYLFCVCVYDTCCLFG